MQDLARYNHSLSINCKYCHSNSICGRSLESTRLIESATKEFILCKTIYVV